MNPEEATPAMLPELKLIVAPVTAPVLVAVSPEKVTVPFTAATVAVPPKVQLPSPTAAVTMAVLDVAFPY